MRKRALCLLHFLILLVGVLPASIFTVLAAETDTAAVGAYNSEDTAYV